jgi:hypothetical protein
MTVLKIRHQKDFVVISKIALEDPDLSFKAKGLWAYCMSRPNDWEFHVTHLATVSKDGVDAIYSAIRELELAGYVRKIQKNEKGKFGSVDYEVSEIKIILPLRDFPETEDPETENPALLNIDLYQELKKNPPPPSSREPAPPLQKDDWRRRISSNWTDDEFEYAWRKLEKNRGRVVRIQGYLEACLQEYRNANGFAISQDDRIQRHRQQALPYNGQKINGDFISASEDKVEITCGSFYRCVKYDVPDTEWNEQTKRWLK